MKKSYLLQPYGHLLVFGATAAVGAGMAVALPISIYVFSLWVLHERPRTDNVIDKLLHPIIVVLILLIPFTGQTAVLLMGILLILLVAVRLVRHLE